MNDAERHSRGDSTARRAMPEGDGNKFTLGLADGRWVSSPTNTVTSNPNLAGVFTAADDESAAELLRAMERIHGPLELVPWQGHPSEGRCDCPRVSTLPPIAERKLQSRRSGSLRRAPIHPPSARKSKGKSA